MQCAFSRRILLFRYIMSTMKSTEAKSTSLNPRKTLPRWTKYLFWLLPVGLILASYLVILKDLPSPTKLGNYDVPVATKVYDRSGALLYDIFADQNRSPIPLSHIPKYLQQATIAIEDKDFYRHGGISPVGGMIRAIVASLTRNKLQGGSTITQQLVKSALLTPERTVTRKVKEIILAFWVEILYPKDKILEMYLNQVPYGGTAWGIETASEKYFGKSASELTLAEASLLAGLPQAPTLYSPYGAHPEYAKERQKEVLRRMVEDRYITEQEAAAVASQELIYKNAPNINAAHFVMYVKQELVERFGESLVERGGLKVTTTLDLPLQEYAQATVAAEVKSLRRLSVTNGAALVTKPATGEILAMVGSTDYFASPSGTFNVTTALRQPGSSIKPINYAIGLDKHIVTPATMFLDIPTCFKNFDKPDYCPKNYDGKFHGPVQLRLALGNSYNIPSVKMLYLNGVRDMVASASAFGLDSLTDADRYGLSLALGGGEVRMTDMAEAFGVFANSGIRQDLVSILKVVDKNGRVLFEHKDQNLTRDIPSLLLLQGPRAVSAETAFLMSHILFDNNARQDAFGPRSSLVIPGHTVSVKTGTTDDLRDNWTIGFTPQVLVAVWVGNNDNSQMNQALVSGVTGAAPIWNTIMTQALRGKPDVLPKKPDGVVGAHICAVSGLAPPNPDGEDKGCPTRFEYFIKGTVPSVREQMKRQVAIDKATGDLAFSAQTDNVEMQEHQVVSDGVSTYCLDCPHPDGRAVIIK